MVQVAASFLFTADIVLVNAEVAVGIAIIAWASGVIAGNGVAKAGAPTPASGSVGHGSAIIDFGGP